MFFVISAPVWETSEGRKGREGEDRRNRLGGRGGDREVGMDDYTCIEQVGQADWIIRQRKLVKYSHLCSDRW